jgi:uncharacterized tellurite resistance protein B-like protein
MENSLITELFEEYTSKRRLLVSVEQFILFAAFYPSLLVVSSDGRVDEEEWEYVHKLSETLVNLFVRKNISREESEDMKQTLREEFRYLLGSFEAWERKFTAALKQHLQTHPADKPEVTSAMYLFAEASEGISDKEQSMIDHLKRELNITDVKNGN